MFTIHYDMEHKDGSFTNTHPLSSAAPYSSSSPNSVMYEKSIPPLEARRINPVILLTLVIVAIVFFVSGLVHLLIRYLKKRPSPLPNHHHHQSHNNSYPETPLQRQLQQLFRLQDSGLDQALIDSLPVFLYKDIVGLKEPFDCAVCLCEFSEQDRLRLLPSCSHAFHLTCIDTWLLSNSTCPLCRGTLLSSVINSLENNPVSSFEVLREISNGFTRDDENGFSDHHHHHHHHHHRPENVEESAAPKRVFSVRIGKFKSINGDNRERVQGEMSSCIDLETRRCYSMGTFQYVLVDSDLQVALPHHHNTCDGDDDDDDDVVVGRNRELEGKKISSRTRRESYSASKIWLWSKKNRLPCSSSHAPMAELGLASSLSYYKFASEQ